jgi:hypothetical protein
MMGAIPKTGVASGAATRPLGHIATDNRHGLVVNVQITKAIGTAERDAAAEMLGEIEVRSQHITVGADKA